MSLITVCCDTLEFDVELTGEDGTPFVLSENDKLWFAVKHDYRDENPAIYVEQNSTHFKIDGESNELEAGFYLYEVGIIFADGTVKTVITGEQLKVLKKLRGHVYE